MSYYLEVYRVLHESAARSRLDVAAITGLTPLVGREQEVGLLLERWRQVQEGMGHVVLLSGEAGIGKSRLLQVLKEHATEQPKVAIFDRASSRSGTWLTECRCSPYHQNSALYPVIDLLERGILQFEREDSPQEKLSKLEGFLMQYSSALEEVVPLFAALLSVPLGERYASLNLTPDQQKQKTLQALLTVLMNVVSQQPVLLVVEDLHWIDPSTLELLNLVIDQGPTVRILTVLTFRPEFRPPWTPRSHLTPLTLTRLPHQQVELIVKQVTGGKALPSEVLQQVVTKTDGVPLFVEELTKMVLESGLLREERDGYELTRPLPPLAIPATLHDSLMARLDRLATVKEVAQLGATLGQEFNYELIKAVSPLDDEILQRSLEQLVEVELLYQRGVPPQSTYLFKHALIQDVAYQSLLKSTRQQYHQRIVEVLHEQFPEAAETEIELLAYHYTAAGLNAQAIRYWQQAGQRAVQRSANVEAIAHFTKSLELLKTLPDTLERAQQELDLQIALGPALIATKGFAAPEVEKTYTRARELCQHVGETPQLFPVLRGLWVFYIARAEMLATRELAEQCLRVAQRQGDAAFLLEAHRLLGATLFYLGEFVPAQSHLEQTVSLYDSLQHRPDALLYGQDSAMASLSYQSWALWLCGYPDQALQRMNQAIALAKEADNPYDLAYALSFAASLHKYRREGQIVRERADAMIAVSTEGEFSYFMAEGIIWQGLTMTEGGQGTEGITQMHQGLSAYRATAELGQPFLLALLAEAYGQAEQFEEGLTVLADALAAVEKTGERWYEAELYRLKGELLLMQGRDARSCISADEVEVCFYQALDVARRQEAKSLELRAAMSLSRLWQRQVLGLSRSGGKIAATRTLLQEIYGWFTEGFDTADLKEAKAVLDELS